MRKFDSGVNARLVFTNEPNIAYYCEDDESVYEKLEPIVGHEVAEDASSWAEMTYVGDYYEHDEFTIEMVEV